MSRSTMRSSLPRLTWGTISAGMVLVAIFASLVVRFRAELRDQIHQKIIERDAALLYPVALQQLAELETSCPLLANEADLLPTLLKHVQLEGMLAVAIFDSEGSALSTMPEEALILPELSPTDYSQLLGMETISRYHPAFPFNRYFRGLNGPDEHPRSPVLEVLLPLHGPKNPVVLGFAQYYIDARGLAEELAQIDSRINRQTGATLAIGIALISLVVAAALAGLRKAQEILAERNACLERANFDLTLSAKASALGQITSHLIHGLQGPVAGLRAVVSANPVGGAIRAGTLLEPSEDWKSAVNYTERMQALIQETVALLGDSGLPGGYELSGAELAVIIRDRNRPLAEKAKVALCVRGGFADRLDGHNCSLVCLIASNLIQHAIEATPAGKQVKVILARNENSMTLSVADEGNGISSDDREQLFQPGRTGRPGISNLSLAISQLLARQIGASLALTSTGREGSVFALTVPAK